MGQSRFQIAQCVRHRLVPFHFFLVVFLLVPEFIVDLITIVQLLIEEQLAVDRYLVVTPTTIGEFRQVAFPGSLFRVWVY